MRSCCWSSESAAASASSSFQKHIALLRLNTDQISICFYCLVKGERSEGVGGARPLEESERAKQVGGRRSDRNLKPDSSSVCLSGGFQNKASWLTVTVFFFSFFSTTLRDRTASVQIWVICAARMRRWSQSKSGGVGRSRVQFVFFLYHRMCVRVVLYQCSELSRRWPWWRLVIVSGSGELFVSLLCLFRYSWGCHTLRCRTGRLELFL